MSRRKFGVLSPADAEQLRRNLLGGYLLDVADAFAIEADEWPKRSAAASQLRLAASQLRLAATIHNTEGERPTDEAEAWLEAANSQLRNWRARRAERTEADRAAHP